MNMTYRLIEGEDVNYLILDQPNTSIVIRLTATEISQSETEIEGGEPITQAVYEENVDSIAEYFRGGSHPPLQPHGH